MALYTSFYTRQLALRPESIAPGEQKVEGEKTLQKSVARRTVDPTGPFLSWIEKQRYVHNPSDIPGLLGIPTAALDILPPVAYSHLPASSFAIKFAGQAPSKTRTSVNVAAWTPDGGRCLTGTQAGEFCLWSGQTFQFETIIQAHETPIRSVTFTHSGNFLLSGDDAGNIRYWRTNLELIKNVAAHKESVRQVSFAPTDLKFASASDDSTVRIWDFARVTTEQVLAGHGGDVKTVDWHHSKSIVVSGSKDGLVKLWCPRSGKSLATLHGHKGTITATQWNKINGNWILTGSRDQTCKVYDIRMLAELSTYAGHARDVTVAAWHPLQEELFVSGGHDGSLCYWLAGRQAPQAEVRGGHEGSVWATAWHPTGHLLATGAADAATKFWCRCRPGDPFFDQQQAEQDEIAALDKEQAATAAPVKAPAPALFTAPPTVLGGVAAIPGIGEAAAKQMVAAPLDIYTVAAPQAPSRSGGGGGGQQHRQQQRHPLSPPTSSSHPEFQHRERRKRPRREASPPQHRERGRDYRTPRMNAANVGHQYQQHGDLRHREASPMGGQRREYQQQPPPPPQEQFHSTNAPYQYQQPVAQQQYVSPPQPAVPPGQQQQQQQQYRQPEDPRRRGRGRRGRR